ncbi:30S ribosomal protein S16 [Candidatus Gottesmanbacteria bacterium]|nr:30S ribosomal protein S16 [Candidatus Gottesmanbacteria bacterium]
MAVKIRLQKRGRKNRTFFRIVAVDEATKRSGKTLAILGFYDPMEKPKKIKIDKKKFDYWISHGAQPTDAVRKLLAD